MPVAYPGALGWGRNSFGGSGRHLATPATTIYYVTNLNDSGAGSLRAAIDASGVRTVIFKTSGTINLVAGSRLKIKNPYITIAGETAPEPGIQIKGACLQILTHNVIISNIRCRAGGSTEGDSLSITSYSGSPQIHDVFIQHCDAQWGTDENTENWCNTGAAPITNVTWQECCFFECQKNGFAPAAPQGSGGSRGFLIGGYAANGNISVIRSVIAHNYERNPRMYGGAIIEFLENVVYNWGNSVCDIGTPPDYNTGAMFLDFARNYYKKGPSNTLSSGWKTIKASAGIKSSTRLYVQGNIAPLRPTDNGDEWGPMVDASTIPESPYRSVSRVADSGDGHTLLSPLQAYEYALLKAGARPGFRDIAESRVINDIRNGTGQIPDTVAQAGGYPTYTVNTTTHSDLPVSPDTVMPSGYTALEEWMHAKHLALMPNSAGLEIDIEYSFQIQHGEKIFGDDEDTASLVFPFAHGGITRAAPIVKSSERILHPNAVITTARVITDLSVLFELDLADFTKVNCTRPSAGVNENMRLWGSLWGFVGASGSPNEIIFRNSSKVTLGVGEVSKHFPLPSIQTLSKCFAFASSFSQVQANAEIQDVLCTCKMENSGGVNGVRVIRVGVADTALDLVLVCGEAVGSNWQVVNNIEQSIVTTDGVAIEQTITDIGDWSKALIIPTVRVLGMSNDEHGLHVYPGTGTNKIKFKIRTGANAVERVGVAHVLKHPDLLVRRYGSVGADGSADAEIGATVTAFTKAITAVAALTRSITFLTVDNSETSANMPRVHMLHRFETDSFLDSVQMWRSRASGSSFVSGWNLQVAEFNMAEPTDSGVVIIRRRR